MSESCRERLFVAGHRGMVGSAVLRRLAARGRPAPLVAERGELDLCDQAAVRAYVARTRPTAVLVAAARVGGIEANRTQPAAFLYENLAIATNLVDAAYRAGVPRLLFLGSSCIYPRLAPQPMTEDALLSGPLEPTNEGYAIAKIAGLKLCQCYRRQYGVCYHSAMPTNLYGPGDNYDLAGSHVLPALIRRFEDARAGGAPSVTLWGTGAARREFLHVDDLADALIFLLGLADPPDWVNVGTGEEIAIRALAERVHEACGARCAVQWDASKPDGTPRKLLDCTRLRQLGWQARITLAEGITRTVQDFRLERAAGVARGVTNVSHDGD
jgi:GDP-L-fucose synthase